MMEFNRKNIRTLLFLITFTVILLAAAMNIGAVWQAVLKVVGFLSFFLIGLSIAFILNTLMAQIEGRLLAPLDRRYKRLWPKLRRPVAMLLTLLAVLGILFLVVFLVIPELVRAVATLVEQFPVAYQSVTAWIQEMLTGSESTLDALNLPRLDWQKIGDSILETVRNGAGNLVTGTVNATTSVIGGVTNIVIGLVVAIYILAQKERLAGQVRRVLYAYVPEKRVSRMIEISSMAGRAFGGFISGQFLEAIILGSLCFLGMQILGFPYAPMVAVLVAVLSFIPLIGAFIGFSIGLLLILINEGFTTAIWFAVFFVALQQVEGNLIYPHVVGKRVMLPGLWVMTAVMLGGNIAGIMGILVSVPLASLSYALLREAVNRRNEALPPKVKA